MIFDVGDIVQLRAGGPPMVAGELSGFPPRAAARWCYWISKGGTPQNALFEDALLRPYVPAERSPQRRRSSGERGYANRSG